MFHPKEKKRKNFIPKLLQKSESGGSRLVCDICFLNHDYTRFLSRQPYLIFVFNSSELKSGQGVARYLTEFLTKEFPRSVIPNYSQKLQIATEEALCVIEGRDQVFAVINELKKYNNKFGYISNEHLELLDAYQDLISLDGNYDDSYEERKNIWALENDGPRVKNRLYEEEAITPEECLLS